MGSDLANSALILVDMQNDFVHPDGVIGRFSKRNPTIDLSFLRSTIRPCRNLAEAFRTAGRPVIYPITVLKADRSDVAFPIDGYDPEFLVEGTFGSEVCEELTPTALDHIVIKKGYGGFTNTPLDTILRNTGSTTCVFGGVTTCICVSTTVRGAVDHNYKVIVASDAVAETTREAHDAELQILARNFGDVRSSDDVIAMLTDKRQSLIRA